jgi:predicted transcriptional regulator
MENIIITGEMLKRMRTEARMSQTELARLAGISQAHIAKIENDKVDPRLSTVNKILFVLGKNKKAYLCSDIMNRQIISAKPDDPIPKIISIMKSSGISQLPIMRGNDQVGSIRESTLIHNTDRNLKQLNVSDIIDKPFPVVNAEDPIEILLPLLDFHPAVLVAEKGRIKGIITKSDLLELR